MPSVPMVDVAGGSRGEKALSDTVFGEKPNRHLLYEAVKHDRAGQHRGTHATKTRAQVRGGGKKPWRQKGTGRARQGTIRAPQWAGGGSVFGPVPRSHEHSLNKKFRRAALRSALSHRVAEESVTVVDELSLGEYKTRRVTEILNGLELGDTRVLIVIDGEDPYIERSARNLWKVTVLRVAGLNVYDVLRHKKLLITKAAIAAIEDRLGEKAAEN